VNQSKGGQDKHRVENEAAVLGLATLKGTERVMTSWVLAEKKAVRARHEHAVLPADKKQSSTLHYHVSKTYAAANITTLGYILSLSPYNAKPRLG
jgi:hypothetical protein